MTGVEGQIASAWQRVLGRFAGPDENFFDAGGTSLQLLEIHATLTRDLGRDVPIPMLFEHPTIRALARQLAGTVVADPALAAASERARLQRAALARRRPVS
jgi:hypothetical protein